MIRTVLGDIPCDGLGHMQCHEHLFIEKGRSFDINPSLCMEDADKAAEELFTYKQAGGGGVVDAQPGGCGRMARKLVDASLCSGVHIVAVTGFHRTVFYEPDASVFTASEQVLAALFTTEATQGMLESDGQRLDACAGLVKVALEAGGVFMDSLSQKLFNAAAQAAGEAGVPVLVHTEPGADVLEMLSFFGTAGITPERIIVCHLDRTRYDTEYHKEVLAAGAFLCYDSINRLKYLDHEKELALITAMLHAGYQHRILLSLDTTCARLRAYGADMGLDYILRDFVPMLRKAGVSKAHISAVFRQNARRALRLQ